MLPTIGVIVLVVVVVAYRVVVVLLTDVDPVQATDNIVKETIKNKTIKLLIFIEQFFPEVFVNLADIITYKFFQKFSDFNSRLAIWITKWREDNWLKVIR